MRVAVTYENGNVFPHFGRTPAFKVYEIEDGKVVSSEVLPTNGTGHGALAGFLQNGSIDVLICGGIGGGAVNAINGAGIRLYAGASGNTDDVIQMLIDGTLPEIGEANCDHHHHGEGHDCHSEGEGCHDEDGGCHGGSCAPQPEFTGRNVGKTCRVHYRGTFDDGSQFDSSYDRGQPLEFICGAGQMIKGFDKAVADMEVGQVIDVHLMPEEAYGMPDPNAMIKLNIAQLAGTEELEVGQHVVLTNSMGHPFRVVVAEKTEETITFDANHEMAGKELNFRIELVEVK